MEGNSKTAVPHTTRFTRKLAKDLPNNLRLDRSVQHEPAWREPTMKFFTEFAIASGSFFASAEVLRNHIRKPQGFGMDPKPDPTMDTAQVLPHLRRWPVRERGGRNPPHPLPLPGKPLRPSRALRHVYDERQFHERL